MSQLIKFKKPSPEIKVIEKFSPDLTIFENKEEFAEYLNEHRDELNKFSTCKLNKMFSIPDYRITKIKGEISLKKNKNEVVNEVVNELDNDQINELRNGLSDLRNEVSNDINKIKDTLNSLITQLYDKGLIE